MKRFKFKSHKRRGQQDQIPIRAIFPNLITSAAACAGITSIAFSSAGRWEAALWAILIACVCDGVDGRVARLLNVSSRLGAELDSLADFVNFGVAPALLTYFRLVGGPMHEGCSIGFVRLALGCSLFYAMCDCFRLARFNTMLEMPVIPYWKPFFMGVPAPGGAWMVLSPIVLAETFKAHKWAYPAFLDSPYLGLGMLVFVGFLMASRIPTISLKSLHISKRYQFPFVALLLFIVGFLVADFWLALGVIGGLYILTVPVTALIFLKLRAAYVVSKLGESQEKSE